MGARVVKFHLNVPKRLSASTTWWSFEFTRIYERINDVTSRRRLVIDAEPCREGRRRPLTDDGRSYVRVTSPILRFDLSTIYPPVCDVHG